MLNRVLCKYHIFEQTFWPFIIFFFFWFQLSAADKYNIPGLRSKCEFLLIKQLSTYNVVDHLFKAVLHRNNDLKVASMEFIAKNFAQVKETPTWNEMKKNPNSTEVLQEIVEYLTKVKTT
jgi:hypothetical protein